ncbi:ras-GEF domain-containing family member 1B-like isoform X5 [Macrobrachium nipponense]|uniref:ras-GEF domain-containing family member 1B-like isoform X5 n=1 Tax=Macrobrachium nipponense TaxID=159736 RepID=UPI0030C89152
MERKLSLRPGDFKVLLRICDDEYDVTSDGTKWMRTSPYQASATRSDTAASLSSSSRTPPPTPQSLRQFFVHPLDVLSNYAAYAPSHNDFARHHGGGSLCCSPVWKSCVESYEAAYAHRARAHSRHKHNATDARAAHVAWASALTLMSPALSRRRGCLRGETKLEVTSLLLEALTRKLGTLQDELESSSNPNSTEGSLKAKENLRSQLIQTIEKVQNQWEQLEQEYTHQAIGVLRCSNTRGSGKSNRSQPAIGLKQTQKARGLPQTPKSGAKSCPYNGVDRSGHHPEWATTPDDDNSLVYEDGVLVSGSLQALVQHAVPTAVYYPDTAYLFAFLLSSRLFIKPHELLQRICDVGFTQQGLKGNDLSTINKEKLGRFVPHMVQLLGEWSETFPYDFRDERMMGGVRTMTHRCIALEPALRRDVTQVLHNLLNKLTQLERYEEGLAKLSAPPPSDFITQPTDITEVCQSPLVMAQQLTHIELEKLSYIGPEEFVQAFAKDNLDACYKDLKKTNNLESYIQWFNRLSYLVATHACTHVKKKQRVRVIEWWIEVARECFNIGNFNSLMGIIAGLNMSIVSRLKKTWSKVQSAKFSVLEHQMDPSSNFSSYRSTLKAAMWRSAGAVDDRQKIVIPFFSLLVKDLYFLNEGCASRLPNGHINFDKFWQLAKQVTEFMAWKQVTCPFEKVSDVIHYMQTTNVLTETGLALASFECEGPENSYEKERYKTLKADTQQQTA